MMYFSPAVIDRHPANCTYDTNSSTLHCVPDTSSCVVQTCEPCELCHAGFIPSVPSQRSLAGRWEFFSRCSHLMTNNQSPDCESNGVLRTDRCVAVVPVQPNEQDTVLSGQSPVPSVLCSCTEPNCTGLPAEIRFEFVPDRPAPPTSPPRTTTTGDGSTTTGNSTTGKGSLYRGAQGVSVPVFVHCTCM